MWITRRGFLIAGTGALVARSGISSTPGCTLTSEQEEGPYYIDDEKLRSDITEGRPGLPLKLRVALVDSRSCAPLQNAAIDIWHCDALGVYSGFTSASPDGRGPMGGRGRGRGSSDATRFLRGVQLSDAKGLVEFATVYPGWYSGRAIHIHVKAHIGSMTGRVAHTGQFFFPEDLTEQVAKLEPYARRLSVYRTTQTEDHVFQEQHGAEQMVTLSRMGRSNADGFLATVTVAVDPEASPRPAGGRGRGPGPR